jgi:glycosyltransferase involved in cell wall biosynthesis
MAPEPLIKVVVTTYNRRDWTAAAIDSVLAQTYSNLHIVIVDDASTDGSAELAHEYAAAHQGRFTVVAKRSNRGVADSIRLGIEAGPESDYVAFLNDDDLWRRDKVERQIELFKRDNRHRRRTRRTDLCGAVRATDRAWLLGHPLNERGLRVNADVEPRDRSACGCDPA